MERPHDRKIDVGTQAIDLTAFVGAGRREAVVLIKALFSTFPNWLVGIYIFESIRLYDTVLSRGARMGPTAQADAHTKAFPSKRDR